MTVPTYTTRVTIPADRKIAVEVPGDMPVGEAELTVCAEQESEDNASFSRGADMLEWLARDRELHPPTWTPRTRAEIDAEINALRDEWER